MSKKNHFYKGSWQDPILANSPFVDMIEEEEFNKKESKRMELEHMRHKLEATGQMCLRLAEELGRGNRPLDRAEEGIIKMVKFTYLRECLDEASMMWFIGNKGDFDKVMKNVTRDFMDDSVV